MIHREWEWLIGAMTGGKGGQGPDGPEVIIDSEKATASEQGEGRVTKSLSAGHRRMTNSSVTLVSVP